VEDLEDLVQLLSVLSNKYPDDEGALLIPLLVMILSFLGNDDLNRVIVIENCLNISGRVKAWAATVNPEEGNSSSSTAETSTSESVRSSPLSFHS